MIAQVTIWNPGEPLRPDQTIIVKDGRIAEIRPSRPDDAPPICPDCIVMPGLIDAHIHTPPQAAIGNQRLFSLLYLKYGVTSVRDLGQTDDSIADLQTDIAAGRIAGPRMYRCGPVLDGAQSSWPSAMRIVDGSQAISAVKRLKASGASCIKTYTGLPRDAFMAAAAEAKRQGLPLVGHTPHAVNLRDVSDFEVQHFTGLPYLRRSPPADFDYRSQDVSCAVYELVAYLRREIPGRCVLVAFALLSWPKLAASTIWARSSSIWARKKKGISSTSAHHGSLSLSRGQTAPARLSPT